MLAAFFVQVQARYVYIVAIGESTLKYYPCQTINMLLWAF